MPVIQWTAHDGLQPNPSKPIRLLIEHVFIHEMAPVALKRCVDTHLREVVLAAFLVKSHERHVSVAANDGHVPLSRTTTATASIRMRREVEAAVAWQTEQNRTVRDLPRKRFQRGKGSIWLETCHRSWGRPPPFSHSRVGLAASPIAKSRLWPSTENSN